MTIADLYKKSYDRSAPTFMSVDQYLEECKENKMAYASAAERMVAAIGEPKLVDTSSDPRLRTIFTNRTIHCVNPIKFIIV